MPGIFQALARTCARTIYVANLHEQVLEIAGFSLHDHVEALHGHGVYPELVLVDERGVFGAQPCSLPTIVADIVRENGLVHDVQKLAKAVVAPVR